jgi:hypothetical protein
MLGMTENHSDRKAPGEYRAAAGSPESLDPFVESRIKILRLVDLAKSHSSVRWMVGIEAAGPRHEDPGMDQIEPVH